jgi:hypothetical protein
MTTINFLNMAFIFQCIYGVAGFIFSVVMGALLSWLKKLTKAFVRTVLPEPEKTGEQLGSWFLSYLGVKHK